MLIAIFVEGLMVVEPEQLRGQGDLMQRWCEELCPHARHGCGEYDQYCDAIYLEYGI